MREETITLVYTQERHPPFPCTISFRSLGIRTLFRYGIVKKGVCHPEERVCGPSSADQVMTKIGDAMGSMCRNECLE